MCNRSAARRDVADGESLLQGGGRRDEFRRGLGGDLGVFEVTGEVRAGGAELGVQLLVVRAGIPVVDPADDLAVAKVDRREDAQLAAEQLRCVDHVDQCAHLARQDGGRVGPRRRFPSGHVLFEDVPQRLEAVEVPAEGGVGVGDQVGREVGHGGVYVA